VVDILQPLPVDDSIHIYPADLILKVVALEEIYRQVMDVLCPNSVTLTSRHIVLISSGPPIELNNN